MITQYIPSDKDVQCFVFLGYDYKQKKPRPRPGLKKKILPSLNAEIYTLTCRYIECKVRYVTMRLSVKREVRALSTRLHFTCRPEMKEMTRCARQNISENWSVCHQVLMKPSLICERQFHNYFRNCDLWERSNLLLGHLLCRPSLLSKISTSPLSLEHKYNPCWTSMLQDLLGQVWTEPGLRLSCPFLLLLLTFVFLLVCKLALKSPEY